VAKADAWQVASLLREQALFAYLRRIMESCGELMVPRGGISQIKETSDLITYFTITHS
jgi:hypothetical protein